MAITPHRILLFFARTWTILATTLIIYSSLYLPEAAQSTDYVMTFYVAGHLVETGRETELYPEPNTLSFTGSRFDKAAHALLPNLAQSLTAAYMHSPLVAWIFSPLSHLKPNLSLLVWQALSLAGLAICCGILAHIHDCEASDIFFLSFLLFPIFITLWIGQLSIVFGLLPLCTGLLLLMRGRPFLAGLAWSIVSLKPQYLPAVGLVGAALALAGRPRCLVGLLLGSAVLFAANLVIFPVETTLTWLESFRAADLSYSSGFYNVPIHLVTSLPSNLLMLFPVDQRATLKLPLYILAAGLWSIALWQCWRLARMDSDRYLKISLMGLLGVVLLPLVPPHMLYYDLGLILPAGVALMGRTAQMPEESRLKRLTLIISIAVSLYFPFFLSFSPNTVFPLALVSLVLVSFIAILATTHRISGASRDAP